MSKFKTDSTCFSLTIYKFIMYYLLSRVDYDYTHLFCFAVHIYTLLTVAAIWTGHYKLIGQTVQAGGQRRKLAT